MHVAVFYAYVSEWNKLQPQNIKLTCKFNVWWNITDFQSFTDLLASLQQENWKASEVKSDCVIHVCMARYQCQNYVCLDVFIFILNLKCLS